MNTDRSGIVPAIGEQRKSVAWATLLTAASALFFSAQAVADAPTGWWIAGNTPQDYEFSVDSNAAASGQRSAVIAARPGVVSTGFGTLMQTISAKDFRGGRVRLTGYLRSRDATSAQMWLRVDGTDRKTLALKNMHAHQVTGTTGWTAYGIDVDVPPQSAQIAFGFLLSGTGKVWGDDFRLESVGRVTATSSSDSSLESVPTSPLPRTPVNADFENP